ncbi:cystatin-like protein [Neoarius graeffei]|uniref:cystatin-like protein n=1 Tax=Neoarius graeffei TaxID=443677 RepID=UPI00298C6D70|nr:cystatin-like protein [Neoarius graeffei]
MDCALKVLLLAALILLVSAQNGYRNLPYVQQKYVDKALEKANQDFGGNSHIAYQSLEGIPNTEESNFYVNARLIVTPCKKASPNAYEHRDDCVTRKPNTPIIDCLVCKTKDGKELVDCARLMDVNNGQRKEIRDNCEKYFPSGGGIMGLKPPFLDDVK